MDESELAHCYALLGVPPGTGRDLLKKALVQKNFALIRAGESDAERERLRMAHKMIVAHLDGIDAQRQSTALAAHREREVEPLAGTMDEEPEEPILSPWDPRSFDSWRINAVVPPLVALLAVVVNQTPFGFLLVAFHVWVHEFGHATIGWLTGHRALPLPLGWTPIAAEKSLFVYGGILFLLGLLAVAGVRERKIWPVGLAVGLAVVQAYMTWWLPETTAQMWIDFGGVGGEFYLSAAMMALFYVQLPEKFRWGACRYFFLFIGAGRFHATFTLWRRILHGDEGIPYGTMINGEEDAGGDMNGLHDEWGWTQSRIIHTYNHLGNACLVALVVVYVFFALRLDERVAKLFARAE